LSVRGAPANLALSVVRSLCRLVGLLVLAAGCPGDPAPEVGWQLVHEELNGALLSVWGTGPQDVWAVGADARDGSGPMVLHFDGESWTRLESGQAAGDLWWVFGFDGGPIYLGGDGGMIIRVEADVFTRMDTPGTETVFGIWGASPDDVWAVGGASDSTGGFAWRLSDDAWVPEPSVPADVAANATVWKMYGRAANDAWMVGSNGVALHWDGATLTPGETGVGSSLFTVHEKDGLYAAVGGLATAIFVELEGDTWQIVTPDPPPPMGMAGVTLGEGGTGVAVGLSGAVYVRDGQAWQEEDLGFGLLENLHGSWIDEDGGLWAVGGQTLAPPLTDGVMIHRGREVPAGGL
jgi:hypothetical protein